MLSSALCGRRTRPICPRVAFSMFFADLLSTPTIKKKNTPGRPHRRDLDDREAGRLLPLLEERDGEFFFWGGGFLWTKSFFALRCPLVSLLPHFLALSSLPLPLPLLNSSLSATAPTSPTTPRRETTSGPSSSRRTDSADSLS